MKLRLSTLCENTSGKFGFTGEWGLSILAQTEKNTVLLDSGFSDSIVKNALEAGIDLRKIDKIVISHGHMDHTGGLRVLLKEIKKEIDIIAHPDIWDRKFAMNRDQQADKRYIYAGIPFLRDELEALGANFKLSRDPVWLNEEMVTTGEVPMVTAFEKIDSNILIKTDDGYKEDPLLDDQALIVNTEKGFVVILGCAHRGIINTLLHARKVTGSDKIYAVVGGTHLYRHNKEQLKQTVASLKEFGIEKLGVSHCTGLPAAVYLEQEFGDIFFFNNAGTIVEL
jgi:7,8-dihydropterin-6-yl-methyl-4-(beta-D-ribofuranosyl)aminobenzene 5'-phosphate synthase